VRERACKRVRERHVQLGLLNQAGTKAKSSRGGKRPGAGRPPKGKRAGAPHKRRKAFKATSPVHVVLRVCPEVVEALGTLRNAAVYRAVRAATIVMARRDDARIVHLSIQRTHLHLLVEANDRLALARGMLAFQISAAKHINRRLLVDGTRRRGQVFADRYHAEVVTSPRYARHVLAYVMNNWRKHHEDREEVAHGWLVDPLSTGVLFDGWRELGDRRRWTYRATYEPMVVSAPRTWLLSIGWRRHGLVSCHETPRSLPRPAASRSTAPRRGTTASATTASATTA
jgi:REP element-mobilizing transposase RayT